MTARPTASQGTRWPGLWLILLLVMSPPAMAWNAAGHRISALIAWEALDERTKSAVAAVLRQHPDYQRWQARAKGDDPDLVAFLEASTWPDDIRKDRRFYTAGIEEPTPTQSGFPDMERRLIWHFVDRPLKPGNKIRPSAGIIDRQLVALATTLGNPKETIAARAYALPWLIHLVGDAHQPLHAASRYAPDGQGDSGGNALNIFNPFQPRYPLTRLHRYWDDLPGPPWLRGKRLANTVKSLSTLYPPATSPGTPEQWIDESWLLARQYAYPPGDDSVPTISADFHANALEIARRRVTEAGHRLAEQLRQAFQEENRQQVRTNARETDGRVSRETRP